MKEAGRTLWDVRTPMRDGVELSADIHLPPERLAGGPYPLVLVRTPYGNQHLMYTMYAKHLAENGYAVALQDVRGRHDSDGSFYPFHQEGADGYDSVEWFAAQEWCTGKVGMMGGSYSAWVQWAAARERPPHLTTMVSTASCGRYHEELPFRNGMVSLAMYAWLHTVAGRVFQLGEAADWERILWHLPLRTMDQALGRTQPVWHDWLDHPTLDDYWREIILDGRDFASIDLPVLHITGWYDDDQPGALFMYDGMLAHSPAADRQSLLIGPWDHGGTRMPARRLGGVDFGPAAVEDLKDTHLHWFDRWLKDEPTTPARAKPARFFLTGTNDWHETRSWPPARTSTRSLYLRGEGQLSAAKPGREPADTFVYDPVDPVVVAADFTFFPQSSAPQLTYPFLLPGSPALPFDRRFLERRQDVLVYTTSPLEDALVVTGTPRVELFAGSDCPDTDWVVQLSDVAPDGASIALSEGVLRARFRESLEREVFMEPGESYVFPIELLAVGHTFQAGHAIRISVTSSWFPVYDRNLNTGEPIGEGAEPRVATNLVFHDRKRPSRITLPVWRR